MNEIPTRYNPKEVENKWYRFWEEKGYFHAEIDPSKKPYSIVIPPPNITGILHMGHALNNTLQDILMRYKRMEGFCSLWMPGTDHAGIATQNVVERQLSEEGIRRQDLGREKFLERVWQWKAEYGSTIAKQLKRLGCSCDWARERFTMDEGLSDAVTEVFIRLYRKGLIYRGNYIINWCPRCQTALSDEEAPHETIKGSLYYIKYPIKKVHSSQFTVHSKDKKSVDLKSGTIDYIVVATTRPETMLGDVAVAINPKDSRYRDLKGATVILPILNRQLKMVFDGAVDPKFGTGLVKVTPAHDPVDFEIALRHSLRPIVVMNPDATMNENAGEYEGMDRFECREAILSDLKERNLLVKVETHTHAVGHCYRCHTVIEPRLSCQWFVKMKPLAKPAIDIVKKGAIKFYPERWKKVYLDWMENIRDWCISRQIWWGHRIPVYYCNKCRETGILESKIKNQKSKLGTGIIVSKIKPEKCPLCGSTELEQDSDVLDTWFSSWLWPFSTFGWPGKKSKIKNQKSKIGRYISDLDYFYPTLVLVTAPEILFFWVARMIMAGIEFVGDIPFRHVYIHGTVRDVTGTKMSKSLGNIIDPLDIIGEFGTDALRFSIVSITATGQDLFLSKEKFELGRNFANKIWNASRFILMNVEDSSIVYGLSSIGKDLSLADRWILSKLNRTIGGVTKSLNRYRFNEAANALYEFFWHEFCDWYIELVKPIVTRNQLTETRKELVTKVVMVHVLETSLRLLHPFMPFITEEIWQRLKKSVTGHRSQVTSKNVQPATRNLRPESIMAAPWPKVDRRWIDREAEANMRFIIDIITSIRNIRSEMNVPPARKSNVVLSVPNKETSDILSGCSSYIRNLARIEEMKIGMRLRKPKASATAVVKNIEISIPLKGLIDLDKEKRRLTKGIERLKAELKTVSKRLKNKDFMDKAPKEVVAKEKEKGEELKRNLIKLRSNLRRIS